MVTPESSCQPEIASTTTAALARALEAGLRHSRKRLEDVHSRAVHRAELRRVDYRESHRDLESLRRLRQRRRDAWLQSVRSAEQAELDEVARIRHESARWQEEQEAGR